MRVMRMHVFVGSWFVNAFLFLLVEMLGLVGLTVLTGRGRGNFFSWHRKVFDSSLRYYRCESFYHALMGFCDLYALMML